jgi:hypothetical protein
VLKINGDEEDEEEEGDNLEVDDRELAFLRSSGNCFLSPEVEQSLFLQEEGDDDKNENAFPKKLIAELTLQFRESDLLTFFLSF